MSIDIDLFSRQSFKVEHVAQQLEKNYGAVITRTRENSLQGNIGGVQVDILSHQYPDVKAPVVIDGIRMASLEDIGAMKFNAITHDPSRLKDYVDIHYLLEKKNLNELTAAFLAKYPNVSAPMAHRTLLYHEELDKKTPIQLLKQYSYTFELMEKRLLAAVTNPHEKAIPIVDRNAVESKWKKFHDDAPSPNTKKSKGKRL